MYPNINGSFLRGGLSFLKNIDFAGLLDGTSKTLSVINQAIPVYYQVKPLVSNLKTISKITHVLSEDDKKENDTVNNHSHNSPIFYL